MISAFALTAFLLCLVAAAACLQLGRLDNRLGADMLADPRPGLRTRARNWLGITALTDHAQQQEEFMASITDALTALAEQVNAVSAAQATSFHNLQAAIDKLKSGELTTEQQDAVAQIEKSLTTLADDAQKADDGYEPAQPPADNPQQPAGVPADVPTDVPAEGGDTPVVNDALDQPVAEKTKR